MSKRVLSLLLALVLSMCLLPASAYATEKSSGDGTPSVDIYFSISDDANYVEAEYGDVMAFKKMTVPYFDLGEYGLEQFYFVSESYGKGEDATEETPSSNLQPGTAEFANGKVTMLHAFIYATEIYYCGIDKEHAGKGYLKDEGLLGTEALTITGSTGSIFITEFWGMDLNFNYYHNYEYPLASPGWGSTADQILLHDGDIITLGHFTSWNFHTDSLSVFNLIKAGEQTVTADVVKGEKVDLTVYLAGKGGDYNTVHNPLTTKPSVYWIHEDELTGVVHTWNYLGEADANGNITFDTTGLKPGKYYVCVSGQYGMENPDDIVSTPGGIVLNVTEQTQSGDVNGDGFINGKDSIVLLQHLTGNTHESFNEANADLNGDGKVNGKDSILLLQYLTTIV